MDDAVEMTIADHIKKIIVDYLVIGADQVSPQASFVEDLGADSIDVVGLVIAFEDKFGIDINDLDAEGWVTVGDAVKYVEARVGGHG